MKYLVDGHNLIPKVGLRLDDPDDEMALIRLLQDFSRLRSSPVEVYFDRAPLGQAGMRKVGNITAHFVPAGKTADDALAERLHQMKNAARNFTVVSSDHRVQSDARETHAKVMTSEEFAHEINRVKLVLQQKSRSEPYVQADEVEEWIRLFDRPDRD